jgi:uncharacterized membrane protein YbhN (UPF0104 family)
MKKIDSVPAYILLNIMYLAIPFLLLTAPFWEGSLTSFYSIFDYIVAIFLFWFGLWSGDGDYFGDINGIYQKIFFTLVAIFVIMIIASNFFHIPKGLWSVIDVVTGGFLIFCYIERKIDHRR